ncbi:MAG: hypothetical protein DCC88_10980 [Spirobacillus cienkowskii]|jgi:hypothetical protein|uniref:Uncharacterized protein n=1 Tax=Spirobacillus cienkowskii TaxID=495820 RepID=A0A369KQZ2_9BACT|nr:MAG: hypothetical protein DCC88_10980 [Spirobacillus cienkowskii]
MNKFFLKKIFKKISFISFLFIVTSLSVNAQDYQKNVRVKKFQNIDAVTLVVATVNSKDNNIITLINAKNNKLKNQSSYIIFYNEMLRKKWRLRLNKNENIEIKGQDLFIDDHENIYVLGEVWDSNIRNEQKFIAKYNSQGKKQWDQKLSNIDDFIKLQKILVKNNNIYVLGTKFRGKNNVVLYKFDDSGNFIFNQNYDDLGFGDNSIDRSIIAKIDENENIYIAGQTSLRLKNSSLVSPFILKLDFNGNLIFKELFGVPDYNLYVSSLDIDEEKNIYLVGSLTTRSDNLVSFYYNNENIKVNQYSLLSGIEDCFILKFSSKENKKEWIRTYGNVNHNTKIHDIKVYENQIYVVGYSTEILDINQQMNKEFEKPNIFVKQFDFNGKENLFYSVPYAVNGDAAIGFNRIKLNVNDNGDLIIGGSVRASEEIKSNIHYYGALIKITNNKKVANNLHPVD